MNPAPPAVLRYRNAHFSTLLPAGYLYTPSHFWLAWQGKVTPANALQPSPPSEPALWRVGLTSLAVRMLGELVDHGFGLEPGALITPSQVVGWVEGFKAISELHGPGEGRFARANPALQTDLTLVNKDPHAAGWLFEFNGLPDKSCVDAPGYIHVLDQAISSLSSARSCAPPSNPPERG